MSFTLTIATDNAAFCDTDTEADEQARVWETARLLRVTADKILDGYTDGPLLDINGATVGRFEFTEDDE